jgi:hypothetical protein
VKKLILVLSLLLVGTCVRAVTIGVEPPEKFMRALKTCTSGSYELEKNGLILSYKIKGKTSTGRCIVEYTDYTDFSNREIYNRYIDMLLSFSGKKVNPSQLPTQEQMIKQGLAEKSILLCKFTEKEREELYSAYQKHDDNSTTTTTKPDGSIHYSFNSANMGSYDRLMMKFSQGPCTDMSSETVKANGKSEKYSCEYADAMCYATKYSSGAWTYSCNPQKDGFGYFDTMKKHIESNMCEKL